MIGEDRVFFFVGRCPFFKEYYFIINIREGINERLPYGCSDRVSDAVSGPLAAKPYERRMVERMPIKSNDNARIQCLVFRDVIGKGIHGLFGTGHYQRTGDEIDLRVNNQKEFIHINPFIIHKNNQFF